MYTDCFKKNRTEKMFEGRVGQLEVQQFEDVCPKRDVGERLEKIPRQNILRKLCEAYMVLRKLFSGFA